MIRGSDDVSSGDELLRWMSGTRVSRPEQHGRRVRVEAEDHGVARAEHADERRRLSPDGFVGARQRGDHRMVEVGAHTGERTHQRPLEPWWIVPQVRVPGGFRHPANVQAVISAPQRDEWRIVERM
jgi:hypothetical protein